MAQSQTVRSSGGVRKPYVAGQFYPADKVELNQMLDDYLTKATSEQVDGELKALVVPHAGYIYSGPTAAYGFKVVPANISRVFILGANHNSSAGYFKFSLPSEDAYETPLGQVRVSPLVKDLLKDPLFTVEQNANLSHIIEVEVPFLQKRLTDFEIVPIVVGAASAEDLVKLSQILESNLTKGSLIVISSDLSHYYPYETAMRMDKECVDTIVSLDLKKASSCEACGLPAVLVLMKIAKELGWETKVLDYRNSGDTAGDKGAVVGYSAIAFYKRPSAALTDDDKQQLLSLSRKTLENYIKTKQTTAIDASKLSPAIAQIQSCFVTLEKQGALRGCIGDLVATRPLYQSVIDNTISAAVHDPRFPTVTEEELKDIHIEISVLTTPENVRNEGPEKLLSFLVPGKHGVILSYKGHRATYLPQVWESLPGKEQFLNSLCEKGAMPFECWKLPESQVQVYEAIKFEEQTNH